MKSLNQFVETLHGKNKIAQDMNDSEIVECLDIIANDILQGKTTLNHGNVLLSIRYALMSDRQRRIDYTRAERELDGLSKMASAMGKLGGAAKTEAKAKSSAENGKKGGRPKGEKKTDRN